MSEPDPLTVACACCLAQPGEPCYSTSTDEPRPRPHRLRALTAAKHLVRCEHCEGVGWMPDPDQRA